MEEEEHYAEEEEYEEDLFDVEEISNIIKYNIAQIFCVRMHVKQKSSCA